MPYLLGMKYCLVIMFLWFPLILCAQEGRIVFWNVENAFDTIDHPNKKDDEYTPQGFRHWNSYKYRTKIRHLAQVIAAIGTGDPPMLVGLCEVENRQVLFDLTHNSILRKVGYQIIHFETADARGIDPAFLYDPNQIQVFDSGIVPYIYENDSLRHSLWIAGRTNRNDTLLCFMHHWPSKYSGEITTAPKRKYVAEKWSEKIDYFRLIFPGALILGGGDFNDEAESESIQLLLRLQADFVCLGSELKGGTHKFREKWSLIDLIFMDRKWAEKNNCRQIIFNNEFLLKDDARYLGQIPFRTFYGFSYLGGYSDHLPIYVDIYK